MSDREQQSHTRLIIVISIVVLVAGAIASGIWSALSGPTGEPAWIETLENMTWP